MTASFIQTWGVDGGYLIVKERFTRHRKGGREGAEGAKRSVAKGSGDEKENVCILFGF
jgi:hypothetical protein